MLTEDSRRECRQLQNRLVAVLRRIPLYAQSWSRPLWEGGPTPAELEVMIFPRERVDFEALLTELTSGEPKE